MGAGYSTRARTWESLSKEQPSYSSSDLQLEKPGAIECVHFVDEGKEAILTSFQAFKKKIYIYSKLSESALIFIVKMIMKVLYLNKFSRWILDSAECCIMSEMCVYSAKMNFCSF